MFNNTYVRGGDTNTNIDINSVSGTLVKNYKQSFFFKCAEESVEANRLFNAEKPCIYVHSDTVGAIKGLERIGNGNYTIYYKRVVVLQTMILGNGVLLNEVIWEDDFNNMFTTS